jgi:hypothetical protein
LVGEAVPAPPAPKVSAPKRPHTREGTKRLRRETGAGVRTFSNYPLGVWPIRVVSYALFAFAAVLAGMVAVRAAGELINGAADKALAALGSLVLPAILAAVGFFIHLRAYVDVWQFDPDQRLCAHVRRRLVNETVEETFPFSSVVAVQVTETQSDDFSYSVDLVLNSGRTVFISNDRRHAADLAALLGVPKSQG